MEGEAAEVDRRSSIYPCREYASFVHFGIEILTGKITVFSYLGYLQGYQYSIAFGSNSQPVGRDPLGGREHTTGEAREYPRENII